MNKLITKIATAMVGIAMAVGVGVAVGSKSSSPREAGAAEGDTAVSTAFSTTAEYFLAAEQSSSDSTMWYLSGSTDGTVGSRASWGVCTTNTASALRFKLTGNTAASGRASITIQSTTNYPASGNNKVYIEPDSGSSAKFKFKASSATVYLESNGRLYQASSSGYQLRHNYNGGSGGFRWYSNSSTTGTPVYLIEAPSSEGTPSLSDITCTQGKHSLNVGDTTGLSLSTTPSNPGSNTVSWSASPSSAGITFSTTSGNSTVVKFPSGASALTAGTEVTITATLTNTVSKSYKICSIVNDGTSANPYLAMEAKYKAIDGVTSSTYVQGYITYKQSNTAWWIDNSSGSTKTFEIFGINASDAKLTYMAVGRYVVAHGTLAYYNNTTPEITSSVIDRVDVVTLANNALEVNNTQSTTLSVSSTGGDIEWSTIAGTGSVSLSSGSNSSVTVTGTSVGTATVRATVGTVHADCSITVLEYATDWEFKSISLTTGSGFVSTYEQGAVFDKTGITVTYVEHSDSLNKDRETDRTNDATYNFDDNKNTVGQFKLTATYGGHTTSDNVMITITRAPGVVHFGSADGAVEISAASNSGEDTFGNDVSVTCTTSGNTPYYSNSADYAQYGSSANPMTSLTVTVTFNEKISIESFEIKFAGSGGSANGHYQAYSTSNGVDYNILSGSCSGSTTLTQSTTNSFEAVNADTLTVAFTGSSYGIKLYYISYYMGDAVEEFGTLDSAVISSSSVHETLFKVDETFSSTGLILTATDTKGFSKDFTTGFTTDYDGHVFASSDVDNSPLTVTVTLIVGSVTLNNIQYEITVIDPPTYSAVSSQDELYEGMKVIIYGGSNKALGSENNGGYFDEGAVTFDGDDIDDGSNALEFTVRIYGTTGFALQHGSKYLQYHGTGNNAYLDSTLDANAVWTFGDDGLVNAGTTTRELRYNSSATRFACYSTTGQSITGTRVSLYLSSATPKTALMGAETFAFKYLHMRDYDPELHEGVDGNNYCKNDSANHYYSTAKAFYTSASFSDQEKVAFAGLSDAVARLQAWAKANSETFDPSTKTFSITNYSPLLNVDKGSNSAILITVISVIGVASVGAFFLLRKKKED